MVSDAYRIFFPRDTLLSLLPFLVHTTKRLLLIKKKEFFNHTDMPTKVQEQCIF